MNKLPIEWIDRLFMRLAAMYGNKFTKMWDGIPRQEQIETWAEMLADMDKNDLATGLKNCISQPYPPTLPEFRLLCLPKYEHERVYNFASRKRQERANNFAKTAQTEKDWVMPNSDLAPNVIYWAIMNLDSRYLDQQYKDFKNIWSSILDEQVKTRKQTPQIPPHVLKIEPPKQPMDKTLAKNTLEELRRKLNVQ